jgi:polyisoprenoid-binding protein YceI
MPKIWRGTSRRRKLVTGACAAVVLAPCLLYGWVALETSDAPVPARLAGADPADLVDLPTPTDPNGQWILRLSKTDFAGYRIRERVFGVSAPGDVVGRTRAVTGRMTVEDDVLTAAVVRVDMTTVSTGVAARDDTIRSQGLETDRYPIAVFRLSHDVDLPAPVKGKIVALSLTGDLTLHGRTHEMTFDVQARWNGPSIQVAGSSSVARGDFGIDVAGLAGFHIEDSGVVEFQLTFVYQRGTAAVDDPLTHDRGTSGDPFAEMTAPPCQSPRNVRADPRKLLFVARRHGSQQLFTTTADGRTVAPVRTKDPVADASWGPDAHEIAYTSSPPTDQPLSIRLVSADGTSDRPLRLPGPSAQQAAISPDGRWIAYSVNDGESSAVWVATLSGKDAHQVSPAGLYADSPAWRTSTQLSFTGNRAGSNDDLYLVDSDGASLRRLTAFPGYEYTSAWSPDGSLLAFGRDGAIWTMRVPGGHPRRLTYGHKDSSPSWSPNSRTIAFLRQASLYTIAASGAKARTPECVATGMRVAGEASWHPDAS